MGYSKKQELSNDSGFWYSLVRFLVLFASPVFVIFIIFVTLNQPDESVNTNNLNKKGFEETKYNILSDTDDGMFGLRRSKKPLSFPTAAPDNTNDFSNGWMADILEEQKEHQVGKKDLSDQTYKLKMNNALIDSSEETLSLINQQDMIPISSEWIPDGLQLPNEHIRRKRSIASDNFNPRKK